MYTIRDSNIITVCKLTNQIEEFENPYRLEQYESRMKDVSHKILVAFVENKPVGFKVGYAKSGKVFYSWMGGILKSYRGLGIASALARIQEEWAQEQGYKIIELKTRNIHKRMLIFALSNGFYIKAIEPRMDPMQNRILLEKRLIPRS